MEDKRLQVRVGLLVLVALALLVGFIVVLGDFSVGKGFDLTVSFSSSGDIASGAAVRVSGVRVGKVKEVRFLTDGDVNPKTGKRQLIELKVWMEERARDLLRADSEFYITARGVLGEKYLGVSPGSKGAPPLPLDKPVLGTDPPQVDLIAARLFEFVENLTDMLRKDGHLIRRILVKGGDVMETVDGILKENRGEVKTLLSRARQAIDKVGGMLDLAQPVVGDVRAAIRDARGLVADARRIASKVSAEIDGLLSSNLDNVKSLTALASREGPEIVAKVKSLADKAGGLAEDGRGLVSEIRGVLGREKNKIGKLLDTVISVGAQAKEVIRTVHAMVTRIARGEGSIGALLKDDEIYDNLREMMRDLKQHPWKVLWKD